MKQSRNLFCTRECLDPNTGTPRLADAGVTVCVVCRGQAEADLIELPELYHQLLMPTRVAKGPKSRRPPGNESPGPMDFGDDEAPAAGDVRDSIRLALSEVTSWLSVQHGITAPRVALHRNLTSAQTRSVTYRKTAMTGNGAETSVRQMLAANHAAKLYALDLDNYDPVPAMAGHVRKHVDSVLSDQEAAAYLCTRLHRLVRLARSRATPSPPPPGRIGSCTVAPSDEAGPCGGSVRVVQQQDWAICARCGAGGPLDWWFEHFKVGNFETANGRPAATYEQLASWLSRRYLIQITETTLRKAASRIGFTRVGRNTQCRTLLDVAEVQAYYDTQHAPVPSQVPGRPVPGGVL